MVSGSAECTDVGTEGSVYAIETSYERVRKILNAVPHDRLFHGRDSKQASQEGKSEASYLESTSSAWWCHIYRPKEYPLTFMVSCECLDHLTLRRLMSYIYGAPILDVSRSHTTTQHSR